MHGEFEAAMAFFNSLQPSYEGSNGDLLDIDQVFGDLENDELELMVSENTNKMKKVDHNKARAERNAELQRLRHEVGDLEFTLKRLQSIRGSEGVHPSYINNENCTRSVWRDACARQLDRRLRAERENMHLTKNLEKEKQFIKNLKNLLNMKPALWNMVYPEARKRSRRIDVPAGEMRHMADLIFEELAFGVQVGYQNVESVDETVRPLLASLPTGEPLLREFNVKRAEAFGCNIVPFGMIETGDAWWQYWNSYRGQANADNVVSESYGLEISDDKANATATFYGQQILQRHVEDDRIVFVWNGYMEPFLFKGKRIRGVYYREQSYVLIKPGSHPDGVYTTPSSCEIISPHFLEPHLKNDPTVTALTKFVVGSMSSDILTWNEVVESLLLDQALQNRPTFQV